MGKGCCKRGFTLIELLVVVVIIGILGAIALPQYQKAVRKSMYAGMLSVLKSAIHAQEVYYLANGTYATQWEQLEIQIPNGGTCSLNNGPSGGRCRLVINDKVCLCLGNRGRNTIAAMMIGFSAASGVTSTPSGYEYVFDRVQLNQNQSNKIEKGLYCRESAASARDYHCTGRAGRQDWYGRWFYMD